MVAVERAQIQPNGGDDHSSRAAHFVYVVPATIVQASGGEGRVVVDTPQGDALPADESQRGQVTHDLPGPVAALARTPHASDGRSQFEDDTRRTDARPDDTSQCSLPAHARHPPAAALAPTPLASDEQGLNPCADRLRSALPSDDRQRGQAADAARATNAALALSHLASDGDGQAGHGTLDRSAEPDDDGEGAPAATDTLEKAGTLAPTHASPQAGLHVRAIRKGTADPVDDSAGGGRSATDTHVWRATPAPSLASTVVGQESEALLRGVADDADDSGDLPSLDELFGDGAEPPTSFASHGRGQAHHGTHHGPAPPDDDQARGGGQAPDGTRRADAPADRATPTAPSGQGQAHDDTRDRSALSADAADDGGRASRASHCTSAPVVVLSLAELAALEAVAAIHTAPLREAMALLAASRRPVERRMEQLAKQLPVWPWVEGVRGFGPLGLAQIVGECGDLHGYDGPAKVWKRMGLAVIAGERQRKVTDPELAGLHGYSPQRRSIVYVIADSLLKGNRDGEYRAYYLGEKERQREKLADSSLAHAHNRAMRHMGKRLLRNLWRAWRVEHAAGAGTVPATGLMLALQEIHRMRQDLLRAELRLGNQIEAIYRRLTGLKAEERAAHKRKKSKGKGHECDDAQGRYALADDDSQRGLRTSDTQSCGAPLAPIHQE